MTVGRVIQEHGEYTSGVVAKGVLHSMKIFSIFAANAVALALPPSVSKLNNAKTVVGV